MIKATKPGLDILQSCGVLASHWVKHVKFESVIAVGASVLALKIIHVQLVVSCINATAAPSLVTKDQQFLFLILICCA